MVCHHLDPSIPEDVAFAESRIRAETIAAEGKYPPPTFRNILNLHINPHISLSLVFFTSARHNNTHRHLPPQPQTFSTISAPCP